MTGLFAFVACFALSFGGFSALSMTIDRHYADIHGRGATPDPRIVRWLHGAGWIALALGWYACVLGAGWPIGTVYWLGTMTLSAAVLVGLLSSSPAMSVKVAPWAAAAGAASLGCLWTLASRG